MKKPTILLLLPFVIASCKKSSDAPRYPLQIAVTGLTQKTSLAVKITDNTNGSSATYHLSNQTYTTTPNVSAGDKLSATITSNLDADAAGDGKGQVSILYKGQIIGAYGGEIGTVGATLNMNAVIQSAISN